MGRASMKDKDKKASVLEPSQLSRTEVVDQLEQGELAGAHCLQLETNRGSLTGKRGSGRTGTRLRQRTHTAPVSHSKQDKYNTHETNEKHEDSSSDEEQHVNSQNASAKIKRKNAPRDENNTLMIAMQKELQELRNVIKDLNIKKNNEQERCEKQKCRQQNTLPETIEECSSDDESYEELERDVLSSNGDENLSQRHWVERSRTHKMSSRIPAFTGKEVWKVWYNRFKEVAELNNWTEKEKLCEMLQKMQNEAGDFVFGQLCRSQRQVYHSLVEELNSRYDVIETRQSYSVKFSRRDQQGTEKLEDYAAELKRLYTKAYPKRTASIRKEDLLRRFLDGVKDREASFQIEYVKEPESIDQAVFELINFKEKRSYTKGKCEGNRLNNNMARTVSLEEQDEGEDEPYSISRTEEKSKHKVVNFTNEETDEKNINRKGHREKQEEKWRECMLRISQLSEQVVELKTAVDNSNGEKKSLNQTKYEQPSKRRGCFSCGDIGHFARDCKNNFQEKRSFQNVYTGQRNTPTHYTKPNQSFVNRRETRETPYLSEKENKPQPGQFKNNVEGNRRGNDQGLFFGPQQAYSPVETQSQSLN